MENDGRGAKEKLVASSLGLLASLPIVAIIFAVMVPYYGWALSMLWNWYFVPYLGLPALNWAQAAGCSLVLGLLRLKAPAKESRAWEDHVGLLLWPALAVLIGWCLLNFV